MDTRNFEAAMMYLRSMAGAGPQYMILYVTSRCNAKCRMCFNWDGMINRRPLPQHTLEDLEKLARSVKPLPQLTLSGGEPLLRDDVPAIVKAFYDHARTRFFTVPTNAFQPKRVDALISHFVEECPDGFLNFCLPFHGLKATHDNIMGVPDSFEKRNETYRRVCEARKKHKNISCILNCVMSKYNHTEYREIVDLAMDEFPGAPLGVAFTRGKTHESGAGDFPLEDYQAMHAYLLERRSAIPGLNPYTRIQQAIMRQYRDTITGVVEGRVKNINCNAGRRLIVVHDTGTVYPCETLETPGLCAAENPPQDACLGNLHDFGYDLPKLLASEKARKVVGWIQNNPCACTWECAVTNSVTHTAGSALKLGKDIVRDVASAAFSGGNGGGNT